MKKCVFIIEDSLKDMDSFFIFLHELLLDTTVRDTREKLTPDQVKVFFLHICWDAETQDGARNEFDEIYLTVRNRVKKVTKGTPFQIEYHPILWKNDSYDQSSNAEYSRKIFERIQQLRENESNYVVLMDVILNDIPDKDMRWLAEGTDIPTSYLYQSLTGDRCIAYSKYPKANVLEKWRELAGISESEQVFQRTYLTRSRGIYLPLEEKLHRILGIARDWN